MSRDYDKVLKYQIYVLEELIRINKNEIKNNKLELMTIMQTNTLNDKKSRQKIKTLKEKIFNLGQEIEKLKKQQKKIRSQINMYNLEKTNNRELAHDLTRKRKLHRNNYQLDEENDWSVYNGY